MTFETWNILILGMLSAMLLFNTAQWLIYRDRIYGLYTTYIFVWTVFFGVRVDELELTVPDNGWHFFRVAVPMLAYFVYYDFTTAFLGLRERLPGLVRIFRISQFVLLTYIVLCAYFCFLSDVWTRPVYELLHTLVRTGLVILSLYIVARLWRLRDPVTRFFITGSLMLVLGGLAAMVLTLLQLGNWQLFWRAPLTYLQAGIVLELLFFSLGLGYRNRRAAVRRAVVEQELARERDKRQREHLEAELSVQRLRQEMSEVQMKALQAQLNPHFLFNSLNSLSSLIADEPEKAEQFVDEMSNVYRYLLRTNEAELTTLSTELSFIQSYYHLLKTRHGQGIDLTIDVADRFQNYLIPPLTLQLLLENAVKHNVVSASFPLRISISSNESGHLRVRNNLQRRAKDRVNSTQKGLLNIVAKYELLNQPDVSIQETGETFEVVVPLIRPGLGR